MPTVSSGTLGVATFRLAAGRIRNAECHATVRLESGSQRCGAGERQLGLHLMSLAGQR